MIILAFLPHVTYALTIWCCCCASSWAGCACRRVICRCTPCSSLIIAYCTNTYTICCHPFQGQASIQTAKIINVYNFIINKIDKLLFSMHLVSFTRWLLALSITAINVWSIGIGINDLSEYRISMWHLHCGNISTSCQLYWNDIILLILTKLINKYNFIINKIDKSIKYAFSKCYKMALSINNCNKCNDKME